MQNTHESIKFIGDGAAVFAWASVLAGELTTIVGLFAAIASFLWVCLRIYETRTVQSMLKRPFQKPPKRRADD